MKKSKFLILGLIALMLAGGLALASCEQSNCPGGQTADGKGKCKYTFGGLNKVCTDNCTTKQVNQYSTAGRVYSCTCDN
jgi:hypothetical protein